GIRAKMSKAETGETWFGGPAAELVPLDPENAAEELRDLAELAQEKELPCLARLAVGDAPLARFLGAVFDLSSFMRDGARRRPQMLEALFDTPLADRLTVLLDEIRACGLRDDQTESGLMRELRERKGEAHFLIA